MSKMNASRRILRPSLSWPVIGAALCGYAPQAAAQVDTSEWQCEFCPFPSGYEADVEVGASYASEDAFRFGNVSGYDEEGVYAIVEGEGTYLHDGYELNWFAEDLGLDSRVFAIDGGKQGKFGFSLGYSELPYRLFDSTSTVFRASGGDALVLPPAWVRASQTSGFTALDASLQPRSIESDRKMLSAGADFVPWTGVSLFADYRRQERDGIDIVSGANFNTASLLPRVIDFETDLVDLGIRYGDGPLNVTLAWFGSFFTNNLNALTWDNPFQSFPGYDQGRMAQEPDSDFQQLSLSGSYAADALKSVFAFSAAIGEAEQSAELLPYTINPLINAGNLPVARLDGSVDTTNYAFKISSRPFPKAQLGLNYQFDERDNQTPQLTWSPVVVDSFLAAEDAINTPYSFERTRFGISGGYRLFDNLRITAEWERTELDRDFQEVAEQTEDTSWGRLHWNATAWLDVKAKFGTSRREIDRYDTALAASFGQNPLLRKYHLAFRFREFGELALAISPSGMPLSLGISALYGDDSYTKSELGLTDSENLHVSADVSYAVSETSSVYLFGGIEDIDATQLGSATFSIPTWRAVHEDDFTHFGGGLQLRQLGENMDLTLDYLYTEGDTSITMIDSGVSDAFPDLASELQSLRLKLDYQRSERLGLEFSLRYETFESSDWAIGGVEPDTIASVLTLGADPYDYDIWVFGMSFHYKVGER